VLEEANFSLLTFAANPELLIKFMISSGVLPSSKMLPCISVEALPVLVVDARVAMNDIFFPLTVKFPFKG
jgi:hypothetical protein